MDDVIDNTSDYYQWRSLDPDGKLAEENYVLHRLLRLQGGNPYF
jgi:hypothetical protein